MGQRYADLFNIYLLPALISLYGPEVHICPDFRRVLGPEQRPYGSDEDVYAQQDEHPSYGSSKQVCQFNAF